MDLRKYPKVELHRHLECSMRLSTIKELAALQGIPLPADEKALKEFLLVMEPMRDLESVLRKFLTTQKVLSSKEILTRITSEVIEDASNEGIRILELRYAPTFVEMGHEHLSFEDIHLAILKGIEQVKHLPIAVGLIATVQRILSVREAERVSDFAIEHKDTFLALDLADNEIGFNCLPFAPAFVKAKKAGLKITVHAGESPSPDASKSVLDSIEYLLADRIGHGVQVYHDPRAMDVLRQKSIPLELCPTSNWLTNAVPSLEQHPFRFLMENDVPVTLNSDDPGVFNIDLTNEYQVLHDLHGFTEAEFDRINDTAAAASFISYKEKQRVWPRPINRSLAPWN
jgi:adenosine deaminase